jgi:RimJ/RimL family protein N-acetyltransferase
LAISVEGIAVGGIGLHRQNDISSMNAELGYWLGEAYWSKGIMTAAVIRMVEYGFIHFDFNRIFARPFGSNFASQKVLEKAGFILEARFYGTFFKDGVFEDELVYAVRRLSL